MEDINISKGGIERFQFQVRRGNKGLLILSKIHSDVEEFIRSLGSGDTYPVTKWSREWRGLGEDPLHVWDLSNNIGIVPYDSGYYHIDRVGGAIYEQRQIMQGGRATNVESVNLSFLRLIGSVTGKGAQFAIGGVYTNEQTAKYAKDLQMAARSFYMSYLKPINIVVTLSTQEIK